LNSLAKKSDAVAAEKSDKQIIKLNSNYLFIVKGKIFATLTAFAALLICIPVLFSFTQDKTYTDPEAEALLQKVSAKYKAYQTIQANFNLLAVRPKMKAGDSEAKLTDTIPGQIWLKGSKFKITAHGQEITCDGKNIWTYVAADKEAQVNYFEESDEVFSPSKIFSLYQQGWSYQVKERKAMAGKKVTVVEMSPASKKVSFFKIDVSIDDAGLSIIESKLYEKSGMRYVYKLGKTTANQDLADAFFTFDAKKHQGVNLVDLR
jgi:outer membrane lipoprotein carrier protein